MVVGKLSEESSNQAELAHSMTKERTNAETVSRAVNDVLMKTLEVRAENVKIMLSDAAAYLLKSGGQLKVFYPDLLHVTCLVHAFHRVSECVRKLFPKVNELISVAKKVFLKAPSRVLA